jgi:hypothetical protein
MSGGPKPIAVLLIVLGRLKHLLNDYAFIALFAAVSIVVILIALGLV